MAFDGLEGDWEGLPKEPRLKLTGVLKDETFRKAAVYHATGTYDGWHVEIPEFNLKKALQEEGGADGLIEVALKERRGGRPYQGSLHLTVAKIRDALAHIERIAPADRPDPMLALA